MDNTHQIYLSVKDRFKLKENLTEGDLFKYEEEYFDRQNAVGIAGAHRYSGPNIMSAINAGWFTTVPNLEELGPLEKRILSDMVDRKYQEYTAYKTDPNGSGG